MLGLADNRAGYNGVPFIQDNIVTTNLPGGGPVQYAVAWNSSRRPIIQRRVLPDGLWSQFDLATVSGNPLASPVSVDPHNDICTGIDASGRLHVAGNMHNAPMRYCRSVNPHSITSWTSTGRPGGGSTSITYPQFVRLSDGTLFLFYRVGTSSSGAIYSERWNPATQTWTARTKVLDGAPTSDNPYLHHIAVGNDDAVHLAVIWRATGMAATNRDLCHLVSRDRCVTWQSQAGAPLSLPVTRPTAPVVFTAGSNSGILNTGGLDVTPAGTPHIATHIWNSSATASRILHSWWNGSAWENERLMGWTYKMPLDVSLVNAEVARPGVFCTSDDRAFIIYRMNRDRLRGAVHILEVTPGAERTDTPICAIDLHAWEPSFDSRAIRDRGELHMLLTPCKSPDAALAENKNVSDTAWTREWLGVLTVDLTYVDEISTVPRIEPVEGGALSGAAPTFTNPSFSDVSLQAVPIPGDYAGHQLLARSTVRANITRITSTGRLRLQQKNSNGQLVGTLAEHTLLPGSTGSRISWSPWTSLTFNEAANLNGQYVNYSAQVSGGGGLRVTAGSVEIGVLVDADGSPAR
ncbi:BNR repeat-containing protein [Actinopolymorpha sp. B9G3]